MGVWSRAKARDRGDWSDQNRRCCDGQGCFQSQETHIAGESNQKNYCAGRKAIPSLLGRKRTAEVCLGQLAVFALAPSMTG